MHVSDTMFECNDRMLQLAWGKGIEYCERFREGPHTVVECRLLEQCNRRRLQGAIKRREQTIMAV